MCASPIKIRRLTRVTMQEPGTALLCWGQHSSGQLGLGGIEDEQILSPTSVEFFKGRQIRDIGCGTSHTLVVLKGGTVYSFGNNDNGQLGHDKSCKKPEQISALEAQTIVSTACGAGHSVALTDKGGVLSWGDNTYGQLGRVTADYDAQKVPKLVKFPVPYSIIQVVCGYDHCLALTKDGRVFTWGSNSHGQLGLGGSSSANQTSPCELVSLKGLPVAQIAASGYHSMVLSRSGALFGFGKNSFGQLGVSDDKDKHFPMQCKTLRSQRVKYVCCGEDHTVALTEEGGVFTFGAGSYGQLGHNCNNNEFLPRKVFELMGCTVSQIACGRRHTLACVPSSGRIYAFGLGANGQLGNNSVSNRLSPTVIKGTFVAHSTDTDETRAHVVKMLFCGGDQSFAFTSNPKEEISSKDYRIHEESQQIYMLNKEIMQQYCDIPTKGKPSSEQIKELEAMFGSQACLNCSFLKSNGEHYNCTSRKHGLSLDSIRSSFLNLRNAANPFVEEIIHKKLDELIRSLPKSPPDVETLRLHIILPECHLFDEQKYVPTIIVPFAYNILNMDKTPNRVIDLWWGTLEPTYFNRLVKIYKQCVMFMLNCPPSNNDFEIYARQKGLEVCMEFLKKLNTVNDNNGQIVPYDRFYIPELVDKVHIRQDYINWIQQRQNNQTGTLSFCNYPFVFDASAKTLLLQTDAEMQMQFAMDEVHRRNISSMFMPMVDPVNPCLVLFIRRENIVQDTINQLQKQGCADFKKPLKVVILGEEALDGGGVRKEFFMLLLREILDPKFGMFKYYEESRLLWFSDQILDEDTTMFHLIGLVCGLAIYNATIIDLHFPQALFKKLLKREVTLDDLTDLDPSLGRSLKQLQEFEDGAVEETFGLTFQISRLYFDEVKSHDLVPNGANIPVTNDNRKEYVSAYIDFIFNRSVEQQFNAFSEGFHRVCGGTVLELFHPQELQAMVVGNENYDWEELEKNAQYKGEYEGGRHKTITFFWEVFRELNLEQKKKFLLFLTGSDRIPILGMKAVKIYIQPVGGGEDYLPVGHTCFNLLDLPKYNTKEKLREKLLIAIEHTTGFGLV